MAAKSLLRATASYIMNIILLHQIWLNVKLISGTGGGGSQKGPLGATRLRGEAGWLFKLLYTLRHFPCPLLNIVGMGGGGN